MKTNTPKLRFPEFRNAPAWEKKKLEEVLVERKEKNAKNLLICSVAVQKGIISQIEHLGRSFSAKDTSNYGVVHYGDIVYTKSPTGDFPYGIIKQSQLKEDVAVSPLYGVYEPQTYALGFMLHCYFEYPEHTNNYLYPLIQKRAKNTINIKNQRFLENELMFPTDKGESQKIADCLASLDELISTESRKLDALASYKKGLMQQLFPAEGETVPKLRFPEFRNAPEWEKKELSSLAKKITNRNKENSIKRVLTNSAVDGVVDQSNYFERKIVNQNNLDNYFVIELGDYVYNPRISITAPVGPISKNKLGKGIMSPLYTVFRFKNRNNDFYEQYFKTNLWHNYLKDVSNTGARHDRMNISIDNFMGMTLPFPDEQEQQKIADCLASLDELIAVQTEKLDGLKNFKKGMLQQLFPAVDEVSV